MGYFNATRLFTLISTLGMPEQQYRHIILLERHGRDDIGGHRPLAAARC